VLRTASLFPELYKITADYDVFVEACMEVTGNTLAFQMA
jgi:hypothetical protein